MNITAIEQTTRHLTRQTTRWDRRLRLVRSLLLGPRAIIFALVAAVLVEAMSWARPWLLPEEVITLTAVLIISSLIAVLGVIWLWPNPTPYAARYFDYRFNLKERVSTALELSAGTLPFPMGLAERQLSDAVGVANRVNLNTWLPLRVRAWDIVIIVLLTVLLAGMLLTENPQADELIAQRDLQNAIDQQIEDLDEAIERIEQNSALSQDEKDALTQPLQDARDILAQDGISQEEAVAAMAEAAQSLQEATDGMLSSQEANYKDAASELAGSELTSDMARAFNEPNLDAAANATQDLANNLAEDNLSQDEMNDLADRLDQAAAAMEESNPAVAQKFREAAEALRQGDTQAAQEALREASEMMRDQQEQLDNSALAEAAQDAQQQMQEGQQQLAQAGQDQQSSGAQQAANQSQGQQQSQSSEQGENQPGQPGAQQAQQAQQSSSQQQSGAQGQPQQGSESGQEGQQGSSQNGQESGSQGEQGGQTQSDSSQSGQGGPGPGQNDSQSSQQGSDSQGGAESASVGQGEGGSGVDTTIGEQGDMGDTSSTSSDANSSLQGYTAENSSTTLGGQSNTQVDVGGESNDAEGVPVREGDFGPNPEGEAALSYTGVLGNYQGIVSDALESGRIPLDQRDVIHDYFSSLER